MDRIRWAIVVFGVLGFGCAADPGPAGSGSTSGEATGEPETSTGIDVATDASTASGSTSTTDASSTSEGDPSTTGSSSGEGSGETGDAYVCPPPVGSACGNGNSIIGARVRLGAGIDDDGTGRLVVLLNHTELGAGAAGGVPHWFVQVDEVDLRAAPAEVQLDMCANGEMWSEENCGYQLIVILDKNGNNGMSNALPDPGEPASATPLELSCNGPPPCLDVELECTEGAACAAVPEAFCTCDPPGTCGSPIVAC